MTGTDNVSKKQCQFLNYRNREENSFGKECGEWQEASFLAETGGQSSKALTPLYCYYQAHHFMSLAVCLGGHPLWALRLEGEYQRQYFAKPRRLYSSQVHRSRGGSIRSQQWCF